MINVLVLVVALVISTVAAYYSIIGLTTIFAAAFWPVVIMASSIEAAKVVCTSWLYRHWSSAPATIKYYLVGAIIVLSLITSLGTFGFLSKAHTDLSLTSGVTNVKLQTIDQQIAIEKQRLDILLSQSKQYTGPVRRFEKQISDTQNKIVELTNQRLPLLQEQTKAEAEVGPLKYVAEVVYGKTDETTLGSAVRMIIILIVLVFDPLALIMLLAANHGFAHHKHQPQTKTNRKKILIDQNSLHTIK